MKVQQARELAAWLATAADAAEREGKVEVDLVTMLQRADDQARADLEAAITQAGKA